MQSIWKDNLPLGGRQIQSFPDDTIVSFHLPVTNMVVGCEFACCYASLKQVFLEFFAKEMMYHGQSECC